MINKRLIAEITNGEDVIITVDDNMLSCEFGALDRGNITDVVNWGIYANRGSLSFIDTIGYFNNQNVNSTEIKNYTVKLYLNKNQKSLIATFKIDSIKFEEETREVKIELVSNIISLQKYKTIDSVYPFYTRLVKELIIDIRDVCPYIKIDIGEDSENINKTMIGCPYIGIDTVWNVLTKICQATMSRVIEKENGDLVITSSFPQRIPIIVEPNNILSIDDPEFVRIENASIDVTKRKKIEKTDKETLEGAQTSFSIDFNENGEFLGSSGITIDSTTLEESCGKTIQKIETGSVVIKTPYKIYDVWSAQSKLNTKTTIYDLSGNQNPPTETSHTIPADFAMLPEIANETEIYSPLRPVAIFRSLLEAEEYENVYKVVGGNIEFYISTFLDEGTSTYSTKEDVEGWEIIESNDLIQTDSYFGETGLGYHILEEVNRRYSKGIECFEIECLFNDYYDENGNIVFDGKDISNHFKKYDVIIPYVMKKGQRVPLRVNADGTPKKFRIIGISYSYDGLLRQKLSVQEERYDVD